MGQQLQNVIVNVGFLGLPADIARKLEVRLTANQSSDSGIVEVRRYKSIKECHTAIKEKEINAVCVSLSNLNPDDCQTFIGDTRVCYPTVTFCLVDDSPFLAKYPKYHEEWAKRFEHYFKIWPDRETFASQLENLRDLLVCDKLSVYF